MQNTNNRHRYSPKKEHLDHPREDQVTLQTRGRELGKGCKMAFSGLDETIAIADSQQLQLPALALSIVGQGRGNGSWDPTLDLGLCFFQSWYRNLPPPPPPIQWVVVSKEILNWS